MRSRQPPRCIDPPRNRPVGVLSGAARDPIASCMDNPAIARLENAIERVEQALAHRSAAEAALAGRHAVLKATMAEAATALDEIIASHAVPREQQAATVGENG